MWKNAAQNFPAPLDLVLYALELDNRRYRSPLVINMWRLSISKELVAGSDWVCNSIKTENACVLSGYISCPVIFFLGEFLAQWRNKTKREYFVTYCIIAENSSFLKIWKEFARIFVFIGSTTADPLFSAKMCRPCIIEQWPSASISFINYGMWRLKTSLITQTNKIKSSTYTCQSFRSSTYKGACAITWWETNFAAGKQGRKTSKELIIIYIRGNFWKDSGKV